MSAELVKTQFDERARATVKRLVGERDWEGTAILEVLEAIADAFPHDLVVGENLAYDRIIDALTGERPFDRKKVKGIMDELQMPYRAEEEGFPGGSIDG